MSKAIAIARQSVRSGADQVRPAIVVACAGALIAAERFLPAIAA